MTNALCHLPEFESAAGVRRRGGAYFVMLSLCLLVSVMSLGALMVGRSQLRAVNLDTDTADARSYAMAAVELGRLMIKNDSAWRTTYKTAAGGNWFTYRPIGRGTCTLKVVNPSGALDNSPSDPVILTGTGYAGKATQMVSLTLNATAQPLTCLGVALASGGGFTFGGATVGPAGQAVACTGNATVSTGVVNADVEATGTITGSTYNGKTSALQPARSYPDPATVFDFYKANGTAINYTALPAVAGTQALSKILLSPASNPYGATNPKGIYVIDCGGGALVVTGSRLVGTLVALNCSSLTVQSSNHWVPAVSNYPCFLVQGNLTLKLTSTNLADNSTALINFNPSGTPYPYPGGVSDSTYTTTYPSGINGLVYATGTLTQNNNIVVNQIITGGAMTTGSSVTLARDPTLLTNPPPGFGSFTMSPAAQSYRRGVQ